MPRRSACTRRGSASTISIRSGCCRAPISSSRTSHRGQPASGWRAAVTALPLHHPIRVAEQWATLDLLSNGRVDFAAGRGYDQREYLPFGVSFASNQSIFEEGLEIVMVERLTMVDRDTIHYQVVVEDPKVYTRPWTLVWALVREKEPGFELLEEACREGEHDLPLLREAGFKPYFGDTWRGR